MCSPNDGLNPPTWLRLPLVLGTELSGAELCHHVCLTSDILKGYSQSRTTATLKHLLSSVIRRSKSHSVMKDVVHLAIELF